MHPKRNLLRRHWRLLAAVPAVVGCATAGLARDRGGCLPADGRSDALKAFVTRVVTAPAGSGPAVTRDSIGLETAAASDVAVVTDPRTCRDAAVAFSGIFAPGTTPPRRVLVIRAGDRWVVLDPTARAGEFAESLVFDREWRYIGSFF